jgi:hypothetical protein
VCHPKHVEQLRNIEIINSTTWLHLVGSFYEFYITMHGSMNIKYTCTYFYDEDLKQFTVLHHFYINYGTEGSWGFRVLSPHCLIISCWMAGKNLNSIRVLNFEGQQNSHLVAQHKRNKKFQLKQYPWVSIDFM